MLRLSQTEPSLIFRVKGIKLSKAARIVKIEYIGKENLWDLEIDSEDHIFFANGIATSNSHGVEYAYIAYWSAYVKKYHPLKFYKTWLEYSKNKLEPHLEVKNLVISARNDGITIEPPSAKYLTSEFFIKGNSVHFGLTHIKGVSKKELDKLFAAMAEFGVISDLATYMFKILPRVSKTTVNSLINAGAFSYLEIPRAELSHYYECCLQYTDTEIKLLAKMNMPFLDSIAASCNTKKMGGVASTIKRLEKVNDICERIKNPGRSLKDTPTKIALMEDMLIGIPLSCGYLDQCLSQGIADTTCREFMRGKSGKMSIVGVVKEAREHKTKKGDPMCFIKIADDTGEMDAVMFKEYAEHSSKIYDSALIAIFGERKNKSFIISRVAEL